MQTGRKTKKSTTSREAADTRESIRRDTTTLTTATDAELEESDPFTDVKEDKEELEENEFTHPALKCSINNTPVAAYFK